jgi:hypothetical protein
MMMKGRVSTIAGGIWPLVRSYWDLVIATLGPTHCIAGYSFQVPTWSVEEPVELQ